MKLFIAVLVLVGGLAYFFGHSSSPADDAKDKADGTYIGDLDARGVPTGITNGTSVADSAEATPSIFDTGPSKQCSECKSWFTGQHFCWGTYPG